MFSSAVQPALVSLFSSTSTDPLSLFSSHTDPALPADSFICLVHDTTSEPQPAPPAKLVLTSPLTGVDHDGAVDSQGYTLNQTVLHIQSPTLRTTYIRSPPAAVQKDLGMKHPWIHLQVRNMDKEWSLEIGIVDRSGRRGVVRCSTFQNEPQLHLSNPPLLHLPLAFPSSSSRPLTTWSTISLNIPSLLPKFSSLSLAHREDEDSDSDSERREQSIHPPVSVPSGTYSHVSYIKIYATCRLRRIWFSEAGPSQELPWEFQLYSAN